MHLTFTPNPILLKELRQAVRSSLILFSIYGMLAALLFSCRTLLIAPRINAIFHDFQSTPLGLTTFLSFFQILLIALYIIVPTHAFLKLSAERHATPSNLLFATPLSPQQLIDGKLASGLTQILLFISLSLPFLVFSYKLGGIDLPYIANSLLTHIPRAALALAFALFVALLNQSHRANTITFFTLLALSYLFYNHTFQTTMYYLFGLNSPDWKYTLCLGSLALTLFAFFRALAIYRIAPHNTNRSPLLRRTILALSLAWTLGGLAAFYSLHSLYPLFLAFAFATLLPLFALLQAISLPISPTRRTLLDISPSRNRFTQFLFASSAEGGILFALLLGTLTLALLLIPISIHPTFLSHSYLKCFLGTLPTFFYGFTYLLTLFYISRSTNRLHSRSSLLLAATLPPFLWSGGITILGLLNSFMSSDENAFICLPGNFIAALSCPKALTYHFAWATIATLLLLPPALVRIRHAYRDFKHP